MKLPSSTWLYLALGVAAVNPATSELRCPGKIIDDRHYISSKSELEPFSRLFNVSYMAYCHFSDGKYSNETLSPPNGEQNSTAKIESEYHCEFGSLGKCDGYLINQDYVFWNNETKKFVDSPKCDTVTSCEQVKEVCVEGTSVCGGGEYACKAKNTNDWCKGDVIPKTEAPPCPKFVSTCGELLIEGGGSFHTCDCTIDRGAKYDCHDDHRACNGTFVRKWSCPPGEVADIDEALEFCPSDAIRDLGRSFVCVWANEVVCSGDYTDPYDDDWTDTTDTFIDEGVDDDDDDEDDEGMNYDDNDNNDKNDDDDSVIDSKPSYEAPKETKPVYIPKEDRVTVDNRQEQQQQQQQKKKRGVMMPLFLICMFVGGGVFLYHRTKGNGNGLARRYYYSGFGPEYELGDVEGSQNVYRPW